MADMQRRKTKSSCFVPLPMIGVIALCVFGTLSNAAIVGDRLVIAVNTVPYSQRQLELYLTVKQTIRPEQGADESVISSRNWGEAITVFTEEMMILQEAVRLGSFAAPDQLLDKYNAVIRKKLAQGTALKRTLQRLGVDDLTISRTLDSILRVASYRQNRNRQEAQAAVVKKSATVESESKWLTELRRRTNTRVFAGTEVYLEINPIAGGRVDGLP